MSTNISIIIGRLTKDIEIKKTNSGKSVTQFTVACNRDFGDDGADFINCVAWGKTAENMHLYCHKGMQVAVTGRIQTRTYKDNNGKNNYITEVVCSSVQFLESKNNANNNYSNVNKNDYQNAGNAYQSVNNGYDDSFGTGFEINPDDLPF